MSKPVVAIAGRPNVGKSQLFNKILGKQISIVQDEPGITRDRIYSECVWSGKKCLLVDTGGIEEDEGDAVKSMSQSQVRRALEEADLILFVVSAVDGLTPDDEEIANIIRRLKKPVMIVANKADNPKLEDSAYEFMSLGFGVPFCVSALHGISVADLMDEFFKQIEYNPEDDKDEPSESFPKITLAGRQNVGKSSILNALCDDERSIVSNVAGTTRDNVESLVSIGGRNFLVTDTSGLRRKGKIDEKVEYYSAIRTFHAIEESECVILVLNAEDGILNQDLRVAEQIQKANKASLIIVNKWDTVVSKCKNKQEVLDQKKKWTEEIKSIIYFLNYSPILFTSAKEGTGFGELYPEVSKVLSEYHKRIDTPIINRIFREAQEMRPAPSFKGKQLNIFYACQTGEAPPKFTIKVNSNKLIHFSYRRYLENYLRKTLGFIGSPVVFNFKNNKEEM